MWKRAVLLAAGLLACTRTEGPPPSPPQIASESTARAIAPAPDAAPAAPAAKAPSPAPDAARPRDEESVAWTDETVVRALADDCAFVPGAKSLDNAMSCSGNLFSQACVVDPCFTDDQTKCRPRCETACYGCDTKCTASCDACKKPCNGDATCARRCAETCAKCKQGCREGRDRCATGTCGAEYAACTKRLVAQWKKSGCPKACPAYNECMSHCPENEAEACQTRCRDTLKRACPPPFTGMCIFNGVGPDATSSDSPP